MRVKQSMIALWLMTCMLMAGILPAFAESGPVGNSFNLYYAFNSARQFESVLSRTKGQAVQSVTFAWASIEKNEAGQYNLTTSNGDFRVPGDYAEVLEKAREKNVKTYLNVFAQGPYDGLGRSVGSLAKQISGALDGTRMEGLEFDGVVLDLEGLSEADQRAYSALAWMVGSLVKPDAKAVRLAIQPGRGMDYEVLNKVSDGYILMLHDYEPKRYTLPVNGSNPVMTPLAPLDRVVSDLESELMAIGREDISKVSVQFNMATAQWKVSGGRVLGTGGSSRPYRPTYDMLVQRMAILERSAPDAFRRSGDGSPYLYYYDESDQTWNTIWYEDEISLKSKINAINKLGVFRFSVWRLGNMPEIGRYGLDVPGALKLLK